MCCLAEYIEFAIVLTVKALDHLRNQAVTETVKQTVSLQSSNEGTRKFEVSGWLQLALAKSRVTYLPNLGHLQLCLIDDEQNSLATCTHCFLLLLSIWGLQTSCHVGGYIALCYRSWKVVFRLFKFRRLLQPAACLALFVNFCNFYRAY